MTIPLCHFFEPFEFKNYRESLEQGHSITVREGVGKLLYNQTCSDSPIKLVFHPGGVKDSHRLTLEKPQTSAGSMGHLTRKGFRYPDIVTHGHLLVNSDSVVECGILCLSVNVARFVSSTPII